MLRVEVGEEGVGRRKVSTMQAWPLARRRWCPARCSEAPPPYNVGASFLWLRALCLLKCKFLEKSDVRPCQSLVPLSDEVHSHGEHGVGKHF